MKAILFSQFGYCSLLWMNDNRTLINRINSLHEEGLWLVYNDLKLSFHQLLEKDNSVSIHQRNLSTEIFKVHNNIAAEIMKDVFEIKDNQYDFRKDLRLQSRYVNTGLHGTETIISLRTQIWNLVTKTSKYSKSFSKFKKNIRKWTTKECPCCLCKVYVQNLGFI